MMSIFNIDTCIYQFYECGGNSPGQIVERRHTETSHHGSLPLFGQKLLKHTLLIPQRLLHLGDKEIQRLEQYNRRVMHVSLCPSVPLSLPHVNIMIICLSDHLQHQEQTVAIKTSIKFLLSSDGWM